MNEHVGKKTVERSTVQLTGDFQCLKGSPDGMQEDVRRFKITAYTGSILSMWWGDFIIDVAGIKAQQQVPILREHARDRIVGWAGEVERAKGGLVLQGVFTDATPDGREVMSLADQGFAWQASMGIKPIKIQFLNEGAESEVNGKKVKGPLEIWTKSLMGETSLVSWGADNNTSMVTLTGDAKVLVETNLEEKGETKMTIEELNNAHPDLFQEIHKLGADSRQPELDQVKASAVVDAAKAERLRVVEILKEGVDHPEAALKAIEDGLTPEASFRLFYQAEKSARKDHLERMQANSPPGAGHSAAGKSGETFMAAVDAYQSERKCTRTEALLAVEKTRPDLYEKFRGGK